MLLHVTQQNPCEEPARESHDFGSNVDFRSKRAVYRALVRNFGQPRALLCGYGRALTGYEVSNLTDTLTKAKTAGVEILVGPHTVDQRTAAMVQFPGGYIAEIHSITGTTN